MRGRPRPYALSRPLEEFAHGFIDRALYALRLGDLEVIAIFGSDEMAQFRFNSGICACFVDNLDADLAKELVNCANINLTNCANIMV